MAVSLLRAATCLVAAATIAGCGVVPPRVAYQKYSEEAATGRADARTGYFFRHRRSVLIVRFNTTHREPYFEVVVAPFELAPDSTYMPLYVIAGADDLRSTTQLKVTYVDNTKFIDEIQVTTKDNIADTIGKIGAVAKAAIPTLAGGTIDSAAKKTPPRPFVPTMLDPWADAVDQWRPDPLNPGYCLRLAGATVESPVTIDGYLAGAAGGTVGTFPVPACATAVVEIAPNCNASKPQETKAEVSIRVTYAHPRNVVPTPLPSTGSMKMHTVCGASVTPADKQDRADVLEHLVTVIKTAQDVHSTWQGKGGTAKPAPDKPAAGKAGATKK